MNRRRAGRARLGVVGVAVVVLSALALGVRTAPPAHAAASRAVVVVGGSNQVISFGGTITGLEALRMVASVTTIGYGGSGEAVCSINGQGNPATPDECLVGPNGEYWSYWRAAPGATGWQYSCCGAGGTSVTDGWVEGWRYGTGGPPAFVSFCAAAGCAPPPTAAPPAALPGVAGSPGNPGPESPTTTAAPGVGKDAAPGADVGETGATSTTRDAGRSEGDVELAAAGGPSDGDGGGGSPLGIVAAGGILAVLAGGGVALRRRARPVTSG